MSRAGQTSFIRKEDEHERLSAMYRTTTYGKWCRTHIVKRHLLSPDLARSRWLTSSRLRLVVIVGFLTVMFLTMFWLPSGQAMADAVFFPRPVRRSTFSWRVFNAGVEALPQRRMPPSRQNIKKG